MDENQQVEEQQHFQNNEKSLQNRHNRASA
jgi:hypothetical protein